MKKLIFIPLLFLSFSVFSQEIEKNTSDVNEKNISNIEGLNENIDKLNYNREEIIIRNKGSVMNQKDQKQLTILDSEIEKLKQSLKTLKEKTK